MKKLVPLLIAACVGGCVASAAPAIADVMKETVADATVMITFTDLQDGERRYMVCAPLNPAESSAPTYK